MQCTQWLCRSFLLPQGDVVTSKGPQLRIAMNDLKHKTIRGGFAKICAQAANFVLRIGSLMVLGRILSPRDFGLVGMVTAIIGVLSMFKDFGLSTATIQHSFVTEEQISTLFWVNILVGVILGLVAFAIAPLVGIFYHEPRLVAVTSVLALSFIFNAAGVQHGAILQRQLRLTASAIIESVALVISITAAIGMALAGYGYWALVAMTIVSPLLSTIGFWLVTGWIPGKPRRNAGIRSMLGFGGTITLNGTIAYVAFNFEKILLGRYWGADAIGLYGRAYQLVNIPTENLNSAAGVVAFAALSRLQSDLNRFKNYFLKGYSLVLAATVPVTIVVALFADDVIVVLLGPKWSGTGILLRLLAPTIVIFALLNPMSWLLFSLGMTGKSLKIALVVAPLVISGYLMGLPYGPRGVALAYSAVMGLWVIPHIAWCVHGTVISLRDILLTASRPLLSGIAATLLPFSLQLFFGSHLSPMLRIVMGSSLFFAGYAVMLLYVMGQKTFYMTVLHGFRYTPTMPEEVMAPI